MMNRSRLRPAARFFNDVPSRGIELHYFIHLFTLFS